MIEDKILFIVYEYTSKAGGLAGNRYWSMYDEQIFKETFDSADGKVSRDGRLEVVAKEIDETTAQSLCGQVSLATRLQGAQQLATQKDGTINPTALKMHTANVLGRDEQF